MDLAAWFQEPRRRRVIGALLGWGLLSFAVLQVVEPVQHALGLVDWPLRLVLAVLALGFPVTAGLAWAFGLTGSGIERTGPAEGSTPANAAMTRSTSPTGNAPCWYFPMPGASRSGRCKAIPWTPHLGLYPRMVREA